LNTLQNDEGSGQASNDGRVYFLFFLILFRYSLFVKVFLDQLGR
jgi:hypothetical protein